MDQLVRPMAKVRVLMLLLRGNRQGDGAGRRLNMEKRSTNPTSARQTRRNLFAAASIVVAALCTRGARAHAHNHGQGQGHGHDHHRSGGGGAHCFLRGTLIRTPRGEREISALAIGDLVVTYSGQEKPIKWIGRRSLRRDNGQRWSADLAPIKVVRSALADGVPHRDLYLSPWHAIYVDGLLVTVASLVNGFNIVRRDTSDLQTLDYFHIELAQYDMVFAEGAPSDTLSSIADSKLFDNWSERTTHVLYANLLSERRR